MADAGEVPSRERFEQAYGEGRPPWDIDEPQPMFVAAADRVVGSILDAGCGTGQNALFFADRGHEVLGVDFLERPIETARRRAKERNLSVRFLVHDALKLDDLGEHFDNVLDSGLFHVFSDEDRLRYVRGLRAVTKPGSHVFLACFSDREPGEEGPRRVSREEIQAAFAAGWEVESISEGRFKAREGYEHLDFSPGGPKVWFCVIRRTSGD